MSSKGKTVVFIGIVAVAIALVLYVTLGKRTPPGANIRIGSVLILTGDFKSYGEQFRDGAKIAVDEINNSDPKAPQVEISFYDSEGNKDLANEKLKTIKERDGTNFVVEIMGSEVGLNAIDFITQNKLLVLSGVNTSTDFSSKAGPYFFRIIPSDGVASEQLARWAIDSGYKKAAIVYSTDKWGSGLKDVLENTYKSLGGNIVAVKDTEKKQTIFQPIVSELKDKSPDVVFLVMYPTEAGLLLKEAKKQRIRTHFMGTDNFTGSELAQVGGDAVDGVMFVQPSSEKNQSPPAQRLRELYQKTYGAGKEPALFTIMGYDCVHLMVKTIREANGDVEKSREILASTNYEGASGRIAFDKNHDVVVKDYTRKIYVYDGANKMAKATDFTR
jgi:branched-chain amino acid transport system substrate-binding protein